jgi:hypothetical protein
VHLDCFVIFNSVQAIWRHMNLCTVWLLWVWEYCIDNQLCSSVRLIVIVSYNYLQHETIVCSCLSYYVSIMWQSLCSSMRGIVRVWLSWVWDYCMHMLELLWEYHMIINLISVWKLLWECHMIIASMRLSHAHACYCENIIWRSTSYLCENHCENIILL